jgi:hypothetical protein
MQRGTASSVPQKRPLSAIFSGANVTLYARDFLSIEKRNQAVYDTHLSICKQFANGTRKSYCNCHVSTEKHELSCSMYWGVSSVIWMVLHQQGDNNLLH